MNRVHLLAQLDSEQARERQRPGRSVPPRPMHLPAPKKECCDNPLSLDFGVLLLQVFERLNLFVEQANCFLFFIGRVRCVERQAVEL